MRPAAPMPTSFRGSRYARYNVAADQVAAGYPLDTAPFWHGLGSSDLDAAVLGPNGKLYFFRGPQYDASVASGQLEHPMLQRHRCWRLLHGIEQNAQFGWRGRPRSENASLGQQKACSQPPASVGHALWAPNA